MPPHCRRMRASAKQGKSSSVCEAIDWSVGKGGAQAVGIVRVNFSSENQFSARRLTDVDVQISGDDHLVEHGCQRLCHTGLKWMTDHRQAHSRHIGYGGTPP